MAGDKAPQPENPSADLDLSPYTGRWVALVRGRIAGIGRTADAARRAAQVSRPKERPELRFVTAEGWKDDPLLQRVWRFIKAQAVDALLVGGAVRDGLLGRPLHDLDFVVDGNATALAADVSRVFHGAFVPLDPERDTARVVLGHAGSRFFVDFARRRGADWTADLQARDFTVNAISIDPAGRYFDPLGGRDDLAAGRLRAVGEAAFRDDPLRTLRAVRLGAELELAIEPATAGWIQRDAPLLSRVAAERIRDELVRILLAQDVEHHLSVLDNLGLLAQVLPEVAATRGVEQSYPHQWDVWTHTRHAVQALEAIMGCLIGGHDAWGNVPAPGWVWADLTKWLGPLRADLEIHLAHIVSDMRDRRFVLKLATLLHDVGKPRTHTVGEDGRVHFYRHENVGAELAAERLQALRFSNDEIALVQTIVAHHMRPVHLTSVQGMTRRAIYRYFRATGDAGVEVGLLSLADTLAIWGLTLPGQRWLHNLERVTTLLGAFFERSDSVAPSPLIDGHELMAALGLSSGPEIGRLLEAIREAQAVGEVTSREQALALAARLKPQP